MTPSGIEPATFRFVEQHLNLCVTAVPRLVPHNLPNLFIGEHEHGVMRVVVTEDVSKCQLTR